MGLYAFGKSGGAGTCTAQFLKIGAGARGLAMGGAFTAVADDATAVYWNPAGLNRVKEKSAALMHSLWLENTSNSWVSYAHPASFGNFGAGVQYFSYGKIEGCDEYGAKQDDFSPIDTAVSLSYARNLLGTDLGLSLKYISSKITDTATAFAVDAGAVRKAGDRLSLAIVVLNLGTKMKFIDEADSLPLSIRLGGAYVVSGSFTAAIGITMPQDNRVSYCAGGEYRHAFGKGVAACARAGYNTGSNDAGGMSGFAAGAGISCGRYGIDYAFVPFEGIGSTHQISFNIGF